MPLFRVTLACIVVALIHLNGQERPASKASIAHRGASAYAPEHTLAAYRLAIEQGADYVEQDLALTRDGVLICLHDESLERTTNVEEIFPDRATVDLATGQRRWLAADFTIAEIKRLDAGSWFDRRFAGEQIPTWEEAVAAIGSASRLYPELKSPSLYRGRGVSITDAFVASLQRLGLTARSADALVVQSFDEDALREMAKVMPAVPRTLLIDPADGPRRLSAAGLAVIRQFATGIGPDKRLIDGRRNVVDAAHAAGLTVTPYTFSSRARPTRFADVREEMRYYLVDLGVDAVFTDNPDLFPIDAAR